ncbi:MAG: pitrilysin family protein [Rickettsiales bacterium]
MTIYSKNSAEQQHQKTILANGLTILSLYKSDVSSVSLEVLVKVGSRYETLSTNGIAHFIEHMNFKGTSTRSAKYIAEEFDAIGGYLNAYTSKEVTVYSAKILKEFMPLAVEVIADLMFNSLYLLEDIEKEKNVVLQELAQSQDIPEEVVHENFAEIAFANQIVGKSILGKKENILQFTRQQILDFIHNHYLAKNIIIAAVGNLNHQELVNIVQEKFIPFADTNIPTPEKAVYTGGYNFTSNMELSQVHVTIGYEGIAIQSDEYYKLEMLANILGGSISSRLFQEIREKRGLVYSVGSFIQYYLDTGILGISLSTSSDKVNESLTTLSEEIAKISENITKVEMERCLAQVRASLYMSRETTDNWVNILASDYLYYGRYIPQEEIWQGYMNITLEELHSFAKKIFDRKKPITVSALGNLSKFLDYQQLQKMLTI